MKVLVIGSEGYVGSLLCLQLATRHEVLRVDLKLGTSRAGLFHTLHDEDVSVVVDLAAHAHLDPTVRPGEVIRNNAVEPKELFKRLQPDCRYIIPSSLSIFDRGKDPYPLSKKLLETLLSLQPRFAEQVTILRFGTLFGGTVRKAFRRHLLLNSMVMDALETGVIHVKGDARRPVLALSDAVEYLVRTIENDDAPRGEILNLWNTSGTLEEYAEFVAERTGARWVQEGRGADTRNYGWGEFEPARIEGALERLIQWGKTSGSRT